MWRVASMYTWQLNIFIVIVIVIVIVKMDQICKCSACHLRFLPMWDKFDIKDRDRFDLHLYINDV